jgi:hypothetical protein
MTAAPRRLVQALAKRWVGERPIPVGGLARDRVLLRRALGGAASVRVLVVGPGLAVRQALTTAQVDVVGTSPYRSEVTVCSDLMRATSLPRARWETVIITTVEDNFAQQLPILVSACQPGGRMAVFQRTGAEQNLGYVSELASVATLEQVLLKGRRVVWLARTPS